MSRKTSAAFSVTVAPDELEVEPPAPTPVPGLVEDGAVEALRRRLAGTSAREHVILDFLDEELRDARAALAGVAAWLANVEGALAAPTPTQHQLLGLALGGAPVERIEELSRAVAEARRRLAQVAARMEPR